MTDEQISEFAEVACNACIALDKPAVTRSVMANLVTTFLDGFGVEYTSREVNLIVVLALASYRDRNPRKN